MPQSRQRGGARFDGASSVIDLLDVDLVGDDTVFDHPGKRIIVQFRHARPPAGAEIDETKCCERSQRFAHDRPGDLQVPGQCCLGGTPVAGLPVRVANKPWYLRSPVATENGGFWVETGRTWGREQVGV